MSKGKIGMLKLNQKEAVYSAIATYMSSKKRPMLSDSKIELDSDDRKTIVTMLIAAIHDGGIEFSVESIGKYDTPEKMRNYSTGLLSNWVRKDPRLNGGEKHAIKNPGARLGHKDEILKNLKELKKALINKKEIAAVDKEIQNRINELQNEKRSLIPIDIKNIPVHLMHLVNQGKK